MSKGISKLQRHILGLLDGTIPGQCYQGSGGALITTEVADELEAAGLITTENRKAAMFTAWRSCRGLFNRDLIKAEYTVTEAGDKVVSWLGLQEQTMVERRAEIQAGKNQSSLPVNRQPEQLFHFVCHGRGHQLVTF